MTELPDKPHLPHVDSSDIEFCLPEDIMDPDHRVRYERFARTNRELLREIATRAVESAHEAVSTSESPIMRELVVQKAIIDAITYVLDLLDHAATREAATLDAVNPSQE